MNPGLHTIMYNRRTESRRCRRGSTRDLSIVLAHACLPAPLLLHCSILDVWKPTCSFT